MACLLVLAAATRRHRAERRNGDGATGIAWDAIKESVNRKAPSEIPRLNASLNPGLYISASLDDSSGVKTITGQEAERHFGKFAEMASAGESILVTHNGQPWVVLQPPRKGGIHSRAAQWPDYPAHWRQHFPDGPASGPTATELLAQDKEDRF